MKQYFIPLLCMLLTGCATNLKTIETAKGMATIVAYSDSVGKILLPLSLTKATRIEEVDGKKVSDFWNSTEQMAIEPGAHNIVISCRIRRGGINVASKTNHELIVEEGKVYIFKAYLDRNKGCSTNYELSKI